MTALSKGGVERAIRFFKERFFAARSFHSLEHGNAQLMEFVDTIAHRRPHPRWPERSVAEVFAEEQSRLLPLPEPLPHTDLVTLVPVDRTAFVRLDTNRYSVPHTYAGRTLTLIASDTELRLLDGDQPVAHHLREWGRNQWLELPAHRAALVEEKRAARALKGRDRLRAEVPEIEPLFERWVDAGRNLGSMVARVIVLLDAYGALAMREVLTEMGIHCTDPRSRREATAGADSRSWTDAQPAAGFSCAADAGGTVMCPRASESSPSTSRARVAAQYLGASSRYRS